MNKQLIITGDVAIDHLYLSIPPGRSDENWGFYPTYKTFLLPGGAFLLADFTKYALEVMNIKASIASPKPPEALEGKEVSGMVHAKIALGNYMDDKMNERIRVKEYLGYSKNMKIKEYHPKINEEPGFADLLILDDAGNGYRDQEALFPKSLMAKETLVLYKMSRPLVTGALWEKMQQRGGPSVLVVNVKDLRSYKNMNISKGLSWERTAMDTMFTIGRSASLYSLHKASFIVIIFGTDGALLYPRDPDIKPTLFFDPHQQEGGYSSTIEGHALSLNSAFTAALGARLLKPEGIAGIKDGIRTGLNAMRNLLKNGFIIQGGAIRYPSIELFKEANYEYAECDLDRGNNLTLADPLFFRILDRKSKNTILRDAADIVRYKKAEILEEIPVGNFGLMETFDRREIEQFNAIKRLIREFLNDPKPARPLCFAVFGPPGSGKSFGVKQVLKSLKGKSMETLTFNISQYESYDEMVADFHKVRDKVLTGIVPVAFFDEFDSKHNDQPLGWLKYFLGPMQDGEFKEGEALHPLGKCIFVFAGGTKSSFEDFERQGRNKDEKSDFENKKESNFFDNAKGPDFISRLRGIINILGPNPNNKNGETDDAYMIRRAKILRNIFETTPKTRQLTNAKGELQIDQSVLRALLNVPEYKHGHRSMNAVIDMSQIAKKNDFELSFLPKPDQLDVHVDAKLFMWLAAKERFYTLMPPEERLEFKNVSCMESERLLIEKIAKELHNDYVKQRNISDEVNPSVKAWEELADDKKRSNLDAAEDIPAKLAEIGHAIRRIPDGKEANVPVISDAEVYELAKREHNRWCLEQRMQGWKWGEKRNDKLKIHNLLVDWEKLTIEQRKKDLQGIYAIPRVLKKTGYEIYRIEKYLPFASDELIQALAKAIHEDYVMNRKKEGDTIETNPNLVDFEDLKTDLYEANLDNARSIPRKLALLSIPRKLLQLNIELHKIYEGIIPETLTFTDDEVEKLSQWEHSRWYWQKIIQGWSFAPEPKNDEKKTTPYIVPWAELTEKIKEYDRESIRLIPKLIEQAGYYAVRKEK